MLEMRKQDKKNERKKDRSAPLRNGKIMKSFKGL
jgi:hypothetical protein